MYNWIKWLLPVLAVVGLGGYFAFRHFTPDAVPGTQASPARLYADVEFLTSLHPARNHENLASLNQAADYIKAEFAKLGGEVREQPFQVAGREYRNISLLLGPADAPRLVVGAHYDAFGNHPGADDNASGVAGLLETARLLHQRQPTLRYRVELVAYPNEEPPYFATEDMGSYVHAKSLHEAGVPVRAMLCYEMIGYFRDEPGSQRFPDPQLAARYPNTGNFIIAVSRTGQDAFTERVQRLMQSRTKLDVQRINLPAGVALASLSDHRNYWQFGYDALMLTDTSFLRNPNYHQASDTIDTLDFKRMAEVVNGAYAAIVGL